MLNKDEEARKVEEYRLAIEAGKGVEEKGMQQALTVFNSEFNYDLKTAINEIREEKKVFRENFKSRDNVNEFVQTMLKMILAKISEPSSSAPATSEP